MTGKLPDDELQALHRFAQQAALHGYPNPERKGCPGIMVLEEVAAAPVPFKHPAYGHIKTCSPCLAEMLDLRKQRLQAERTATAMNQEQFASAAKDSAALDNAETRATARWLRRPWIWIAACAVVILIASLVVKSFVHFLHQPAVSSNNNQLVLLDRTINLWDRDTSRTAGEAVPLEAVLLPSALVRAKIILPRASESGTYTIAVTSDKYGQHVLAKGLAPSVVDGPRQFVTVILDLRKTKAGTYFLETTQDQNEASYYYPLTVR